MRFHLSRYDFRLPRYRRAKRKVIFDRLLSLSFSLTRISRSRLVSLTYPKLPDKQQLRFLEIALPGKKSRSVGRGPIHNFFPTRYTLTPYISATDWDIGIKQKRISMVWFPLHSKWILVTKCLIFFIVFYTKNWSFIYDFTGIYWFYISVI